MKFHANILKRKKVLYIFGILGYFTHLFGQGCPNQGPELWILITDNQYKTWTITANVFNDSLVYDEDLAVTNNYDYSSKTFGVQAGIGTTCTGFGWIVEEEEEQVYPYIGYGIYQITVTRGEGYTSIG